MKVKDNGKLRRWASGATRDTANDKPEPWGFMSSLVEKRFSQYMQQHRIQSDGELRDSDNWCKGIPIDSYYQSLGRHCQDLRLIYEGFPEEARTKDITEALCGIFFNTQGLIYELLKTESRGIS